MTNHSPGRRVAGLLAAALLANLAGGLQPDTAALEPSPLRGWPGGSSRSPGGGPVPERRHRPNLQPLGSGGTRRLSAAKPVLGRWETAAAPCNSSSSSPEYTCGPAVDATGAGPAPRCCPTQTAGLGAAMPVACGINATSGWPICKPCGLTCDIATGGVTCYTNWRCTSNAYGCFKSCEGPPCGPGALPCFTPTPDSKDPLQYCSPAQVGRPPPYIKRVAPCVAPLAVAPSLQRLL